MTISNMLTSGTNATEDISSLYQNARNQSIGDKRQVFHDQKLVLLSRSFRVRVPLR
jgi:hypothetical protein